MSVDKQAVAEDLRARVRALLGEHDPVSTDPREFLGARFDAGLAWVHFPRRSGGLDMPRSFAPQVEAELTAAGAPPGGGGARNGIGMGMAAPTIAAFGTAEQQRKFLRPLFTGEHFYCQLFSEPGAGSDLAGVSTRAVRDGDDWIVNGQKVWTSSAQKAQRAILVARTDPTVPKHQGLTYFVCDMTDPGVDVRPLRQITGEAEFNEVFLTDVRVPDVNRLGPEGAGMKVAFARLAQAVSGFEIELHPEEGLQYDDWTMRQPEGVDFTGREPGYRYLRAKGNSIEGGTSEILRNTIAERILGLPPEHRVDKDIAFKDLDK